MGGGGVGGWGVVGLAENKANSAPIELELELELELSLAKIVVFKVFCVNSNKINQSWIESYRLHHFLASSTIGTLLCVSLCQSVNQSLIPFLLSDGTNRLLAIFYILKTVPAARAYTTHPIPQGFFSFLLKPYIKAVTHSCEVEWWRTLMVECVTVF